MVTAIEQKLFERYQQEVERKSKKLRAQYSLIDRYIVKARSAAKKNKPNRYEIRDEAELKISKAEQIKETCIDELNELGKHLISLGFESFGNKVLKIPFDIKKEFDEIRFKKAQKAIKAAQVRMGVIEGILRNRNRIRNGMGLRGHPNDIVYDYDALEDEYEQLECTVTWNQSIINSYFLSREEFSDKDIIENPKEVLTVASKNLKEILEEKTSVVKNIDDLMNKVHAGNINKNEREELFLLRNVVYMLNIQLDALYSLVDKIKDKMQNVDGILSRVVVKIKDVVASVSFPKLKRLPVLFDRKPYIW